MAVATWHFFFHFRSNSRNLNLHNTCESEVVNAARKGCSEAKKQCRNERVQAEV